MEMEMVFFSQKGLKANDLDSRETLNTKSGVQRLEIYLEVK